jgi:hypothetical protein
MVSGPGVLERVIQSYESAPQEIQKAYGNVPQKFKASQQKLLSLPFLLMNPDYVVSFMETAVICVNPPHRFLVGFAAWVLVACRALVPTWIMDRILVGIADDSVGVVAVAVESGQSGIIESKL